MWQVGRARARGEGSGGGSRWALAFTRGCEARGCCGPAGGCRPGSLTGREDVLASGVRQGAVVPVAGRRRGAELVLPLLPWMPGSSGCQEDPVVTDAFGRATVPPSGSRIGPRTGRATGPVGAVRGERGALLHCVGDAGRGCRLSGGAPGVGLSREVHAAPAATVGQFREVERVRLLVDGQPVGFLPGPRTWAGARCARRVSPPAGVTGTRVWLRAGSLFGRGARRLRRGAGAEADLGGGSFALYGQGPRAGVGEGVPGPGAGDGLIAGIAAEESGTGRPYTAVAVVLRG